MINDINPSLPRQGNMSLRLHAAAAARNITLHVNVLTVNHASVTLDNANAAAAAAAPAVTNVRYDNARQFIIFDLSDELKVRTYLKEYFLLNV